MEIKKGDRIMTLYKALKAISNKGEFDGDFYINFPKSFPMESGDFGFSGATFAVLAEEAPEAFTLKVTNISITHDEHGWDTAEIDTAYGKGYVDNISDTLNGGDETLTVQEVLDLRGFNPMVDDVRDFTLREVDEIAGLADTDIYDVIHILGEMAI